jgi:hypothetical protein
MTASSAPSQPTPTASSLAIRVRCVAAALAAADEDTARAELRMLSDEARLLSALHPLLPSVAASLEHRLQIAAQRDGLGRI